jgi:hypothetical protein
MFWLPPPVPATTLTRDPCPACRCTSYVFKGLDLTCVGCDRTREHATRITTELAQRDGNGSLLCQQCKDPYPYAEPDAHGKFVCHSCKVSHDQS